MVKNLFYFCAPGRHRGTTTSRPPGRWAVVRSMRVRGTTLPPGPPSGQQLRCGCTTTRRTWRRRRRPAVASVALFFTRITITEARTTSSGGAAHLQLHDRWAPAMAPRRWASPRLGRRPVTSNNSTPTPTIPYYYHPRWFF